MSKKFTLDVMNVISELSLDASVIEKICSRINSEGRLEAATVSNKLDPINEFSDPSEPKALAVNIG